MIVKSQKVKRAIITALADEELVEIITQNPLTILQGIMAIFHVTTAFRKIKWLLNEGLLIVDKIVITSSGKKFSLYHSTLKAINVRYENNDVIVEAEQNFDIAKKWLEKFLSLD